MFSFSFLLILYYIVYGEREILEKSYRFFRLNNLLHPVRVTFQPLANAHEALITYGLDMRLLLSGRLESGHYRWNNSAKLQVYR